MLRWPVKDPIDVLDYEVDWSDSLGTEDRIIASSFLAPEGLTVDRTSFTGTVATVWLSGGTVGVTYEISNTITTQDGRTRNASVQIRIKDK